MISALSEQVCDLHCGLLLGEEPKGQIFCQDLTCLYGEYVLEYGKQ